MERKVLRNRHRLFELPQPCQCRASELLSQLPNGTCAWLGSIQPSKIFQRTLKTFKPLKNNDSSVCYQQPTTHHAWSIEMEKSI
ncbi:hypothetical protein, partial [Rhizobium ecuadorense]|uniref:hypothetical protein n=1 Tax=Rhizobium ecuadorense TaxID=1671795 RepID=UPI001AEBB65B